jgi:hypothetical protein
MPDDLQKVDSGPGDIAWSGVNAAEGESSVEVARASTIATAQREVESAVILAKRYPRNEDAAYASIMVACGRPNFAEKGNYAFPRGKKKNDQDQWVDNLVKGPSVYLARELAKAWGNIRFGFRITFDDVEEREIEAYAWDLERNLHNSAATRFRKLVQRKVWIKAKTKGEKDYQETQWVTPDERDLREMTSKQAALLIRNCILQLIPADFIDDAREKCEATKLAKVKEDPEKSLKAVIVGFAGINVSAETLEALLGHPVGQCSPPEIVDLKGIYAAIRDGQATIGEYIDRRRAMEADGIAKASIKLSDLKVREGVPSDAPPAAGEKTVEKPAMTPAEVTLGLEQAAAKRNIPPKAIEEWCMTTFGVEAFGKLNAEQQKAASKWIKDWKPPAPPREREPGED